MSASPLFDLFVLERFGPASSALGRRTVCFAGLLAASLGATVVRVDEAEHVPPQKPGGQDKVSRFLNHGKRHEGPEFEPPPGTFLLTDDESLFEVWPTEAKILARGAFGIGTDRPQSNLTILAASGLLDIVGEPGKPPLGLPGQAAAYAAGLAVFDALLASCISLRSTGSAVRAEVSCLDVATWLNWKLRLDSVSGPREAGLSRREEWTVKACRDGFVAAIFLDPDIGRLAELTGNDRLLDPEFASGPSRREHLREFHQILGKAAASRSRDEFIAHALKLRLPFAPVLDLSEVLADEQIRARDFFSDGASGTRPQFPLLWNGERPGAVGGEAEIVP